MTGLKVSLVQQLHLEDLPADSLPLEVVDTLTSVTFEGPEYEVQAFSEGVAHLSVKIPRSAGGVCRGPRELGDEGASLTSKRALFYTQCYLKVSTSTGDSGSVIFLCILARNSR